MRLKTDYWDRLVTYFNELVLIESLAHKHDLVFLVRIQFFRYFREMDALQAFCFRPFLVTDKGVS